MACNILAIRMVPWHEKTSEKRSDRTSGILLPHCGFCARGTCSGSCVQLSWTQQHRRHRECRSRAYGLSACCLGTDSCSRGITISGTLAGSVGMDSESNSLDWYVDCRSNSLDWYVDCRSNSLDWYVDCRSNSLDWRVYCFCVCEHP